MTGRWEPRPPADQLDPRLMRWCVWPGCPEWFDIQTGPHCLGWKYTRDADICNVHSGIGHFPTKRILWLGVANRRLNVGVPTCPCGWEDMPRQTLGEMIEAWQVHALTVGR